jgi:hypothetical protein
MNRNRKLRAMMLDWAKAIHQAIGIESPRIFIGVFALLGFILFGAAAWVVDHGYRVKLKQENAAAMVQQVPAQPVPTLVNATTGSGSPILPNNSGNVTISTESHPHNQPPPKDKPK